MQKKSTLLATATALAVGAGLLLAPVAQAKGRGADVDRGPRAGQMAPSFEELDVDGSGAITAEDLEAFKAAKFAEIDTNGDGKLDTEELAADIKAKIEQRGLEPRRKGGVEWTPSVDDRQIEWMAEGRVIQLDTDGDSAVSMAEMDAGAKGKGRGHRGGDLIKRADADGDGQVTAEEFQAAMDHVKHRGPGRDRDRDNG